MAIKLGQRGRRLGGGRKLTNEQEREVRKLLIDKTPDELRLPFVLWTRDAIRLAIKQRCETDLPLRTITDYLKRCGFTPQKPIKRAYKQSPRQGVQQWLDTTHPVIAVQARKEKA